MGKIQRGATPKSQGKIRSNQEEKLRQPRLSFSFEYLQSNHAKFTAAQQGSNYFSLLFERLKEVCCWDRDRFVRGYTLGPAWRIHQHKWGQDSSLTEATFGTGLNGSANQEHDDAAWQFQITANQHGRVHGFLVGDTFFIVWLDPNHLLYR